MPGPPVRVAPRDSGRHPAPTRLRHAGDDEFIRVRVGRVGDRIVAAPLERAAGVIMSLVRADGLVTIPRFSEGVAAGSEVEVELLGEAEAIEHTAVAIGSHDPGP